MKHNRRTTTAKLKSIGTKYAICTCDKIGNKAVLKTAGCQRCGKVYKEEDMR